MTNMTASECVNKLLMLSTALFAVLSVIAAIDAYMSILIVFQFSISYLCLSSVSTSSMIEQMKLDPSTMVSMYLAGADMCLMFLSKDLKPFKPIWSGKSYQLSVEIKYVNDIWSMMSVLEGYACWRLTSDLTSDNIFNLQRSV